MPVPAADVDNEVDFVTTKTASLGVVAVSTEVVSLAIVPCIATHSGITKGTMNKRKKIEELAVISIKNGMP